MNAPPVVLTIAGFDPSSGAGITADIKTIAAHGCYGISCITALTVQSTTGVREVSPVPATLVRSTLQELAADLPISAIHIGMLGSGEVANVVTDFLTDLLSRDSLSKKSGASIDCHPDRSAPDSGARSGGTLRSPRATTEVDSAEQSFPAIILDPILRSSSGADLLDAAGQEILRQRLLPLATVVTPNLDEATVLTGQPVISLDDMYKSAEVLHKMGARAVVVKGGHLEGMETVDLLSQAEPNTTAEKVDESTSARQSSAREVQALTQEFHGVKIDSRATHGTGCAFASALACNLALKKPFPEAVSAAKQFVSDAIAHAYPLGHGHGPMNHLFMLDQR
jgi:hydroxymethylpyrimidine/phosphomethylpyrimidine kinase